MSVRKDPGGRLGAPFLLLALGLGSSGCAGLPERDRIAPEHELRVPGSDLVDLAVLRADDGLKRLYLADTRGARILVRAAREGRHLAEWPLGVPGESRPVALAIGEGWLLVAERSPPRVRAFDPVSGGVLAELPAAIGLKAPGALAAWPLRRGWHTVLVADLEQVADQVAPSGAVRVWQMRRRPDGRTHAWRARTLTRDALGAPLPPVRALAEDPEVDLTLVVTEPDGRLHLFRSDGTPLGHLPAGVPDRGWRRVVAVDCPGGGFWLALREDGAIERRGRADLALEGRSRPLEDARALAWLEEAEERLVVLFPDRLRWYRPEALGLGSCAAERPQAEGRQSGAFEEGEKHRLAAP